MGPVRSTDSRYYSNFLTAIYIEHNVKIPSNLLSSLKIVIHPIVHLLQSQVSIQAVKTFHYKVLSKLYRNDELNFLVNFNLDLSSLKRS